MLRIQPAIRSVISYCLIGEAHKQMFIPMQCHMFCANGIHKLRDCKKQGPAHKHCGMHCNSVSEKGLEGLWVSP